MTMFAKKDDMSEIAFCNEDIFEGLGFSPGVTQLRPEKGFLETGELP